MKLTFSPWAPGCWHSQPIGLCNFILGGSFSAVYISLAILFVFFFFLPLISCSGKRFGPIMTDKWRLDLLAEISSTGCQHACVIMMARGSFQKMAKDLLGKDLQEVQDWWKPPGIMKGTKDILEPTSLGQHLCGQLLEETVVRGVLIWGTEENPRENSDTGHLEWIFIGTKPDFTNCRCWPICGSWNQFCWSRSFFSNIII